MIPTSIRNQFTQSNIPLFIAFFAFIVIGMPGGILPIAWVYMDDTFNVSVGSLGIVLAASTSGHLISSFLSGRVITKYGLGNALISASPLMGIGALGFVLTPSWALLLPAAFFAGFGGGILDSSLNSFVSTHYSVGQLNWLHAFFGVGLAIGPLLVSFWIDLLGQSWRWSYGVVAVLQLILLSLLIATRHRWVIPDDSEGNEKEFPSVERPKDSPRLRETLMLPVVLLSLLFFFLYGGAEIGVAQLTPILFVDGRNIAESTASIWVFIFLGSFTGGRMIFGTIGNRFETNSLMRSTLAIASLSSFLLWLNIGAIFTILSLILLGVAFAPMFAALISETAKRVGKRHAPNAIGFQIGFAGVGIAVLPGLAAILAEYIDLEIIGPFLTINIIIMFAVYELILWHERQAPQPIPVVATD